ncbi:hypothetical protein F5Y05DRAFT_52834 [Hypoxylon sp. FL0543]|nr:hypothetical protein F5Y05DRAFT_52834 [Hypoxylon sp. FL0543]
MGFSISSSALGAATGVKGGATTIRVLLALAPVALPTAYLMYLKRSLARRTVASARISPPDPPLPASATSSRSGGGDVLPSEVQTAPEEFVVARERVVSAPVPIAELRPEFVAADGTLDGGLLEAYLGATMRAFSWTPQALLMARMGGSLADPEGYRRTFDSAYLGSCAFEVGDRVCGVYVVRARDGGRVVLDLSPPAGWKGPVVTGALDVGFDLDGDEVRFVNETVMWRKKEAKPTLLEGKVGRWLHTLMASWLVVKGIEVVTGGKVKSS